MGKIIEPNPTPYVCYKALIIGFFREIFLKKLKA